MRSTHTFYTHTHTQLHTHTKTLTRTHTNTNTCSAYIHIFTHTHTHTIQVKIGEHSILMAAEIDCIDPSAVLEEVALSGAKPPASTSPEQQGNSKSNDAYIELKTYK